MHSAGLSSRSAFPKGLRGFTLPPSFFKFIWVSRGVCVVGGCHSTVKQRQPHLASRCSMVFKGANKVILSFVEVVVCTASHGMTSATAATAAAAVGRAGIREGKGKPRKAIHRTGLSPRPGLQDQGCNSLHSNAVKYVKCYQFHQSSSKLYISLGQNMAKKTIGKDWEPCQVLALLSSLFN